MGVRPIYFLHIPKTGGLSVRQWVLQQVEASQACQEVLLEGLFRVPSADLQRYALFSGHFHGYLHGLLDTKPRVVTVLRDPLSRTISHYNHIRRVENDPERHRVMSQSFDAFVADPENRRLIENFQARHLARPRQSLERLAAGMTDEAFARFELCQRADAASLQLSPDELLHTATETIERSEVIGTTDGLHGFLVRCAKAFGWPEPSPNDVPRVNLGVMAEGFSISDETKARLHEMTAIDQVLYDRAHHMKSTENSANPGLPPESPP
jgi:hypothetical protein